MTNNIFVKCNVCGCISDLRWQVGMLSESTFRISCGRCKNLIEGKFKCKNLKFDYEFKNAEEIEYENNIKCDFVVPISSEILTEKMYNGEEGFKPTPFINILSVVDWEKFQQFSNRFQKSAATIEAIKDKNDVLNNLYANTQFNYLRQMLKKEFSVNIKKPTTRNICSQKYNIDIKFYESFVNGNKYNELKEKVMKKYKKTISENKKEYEKLIESLSYDINFLEKRIRTVLELFINNYNYFIPVILLDYLNDSERKNVYNKYSITTVRFEDIREMYLRIYENVMECSAVIVGLNNILNRHNYDKIDETVINKKTTLTQYKELSKGDKIKYTVRDEFFNMIIPNFDRNIRNAIGHEDIEYDAFNQKISYNNNEVYLVEYAYSIWQCYESCLLIYEIILDIKLKLLGTDSNKKIGVLNGRSAN